MHPDYLYNFVGKLKPGISYESATIVVDAINKLLEKNLEFANAKIVEKIKMHVQLYPGRDLEVGVGVGIYEKESSP